MVRMHRGEDPHGLRQMVSALHGCVSEIGWLPGIRSRTGAAGAGSAVMVGRPWLRSRWILSHGPATKFDESGA